MPYMKMLLLLPCYRLFLRISLGVACALDFHRWLWWILFF